MVFSYNQEKKPPRPECKLDIRNPREFNKSETVKAFADTGADMTMIPRSVIEKLGNIMQGQIMCRTVNGTTQKTTYFVDIKIGEHDFEGSEVVGISHEKAIIGRDILNKNKASFYAEKNSWRLNCGENCTKTPS